jgi:NAD(P)-dependent dehydrogenase (short-subunit alcohol dehydrogenase family)
MWRDSIETALLGPIEIMRHYIPSMKEKGWGRILNIATFSAKKSNDLALNVRTSTINSRQLHGKCV